MRIGRAFLTVLFVSAGAALIPREAAAQGHGVITGRVVDERGDPVVNATVVAWAPTMSGGYRRSSRDAEARSDDRGIYRLHSLRPRWYVVCVVRGFQPPPLGEAQRLQYDIDRVRETAELTTGPRSDAARERLPQLALGARRASPECAFYRVQLGVPVRAVSRLAALDDVRTWLVQYRPVDNQCRGLRQPIVAFAAGYADNLAPGNRDELPRRRLPIPFV